MTNLEKTLNKISDALQIVEKENIDLGKKTELSFKANKHAQVINTLGVGIIELKNTLKSEFSQKDSKDQEKLLDAILKVRELENLINAKKYSEAKKIILDLSKLKIDSKKNLKLNINLSQFRFADEIKENICADLIEVEKTFNAECYRSSTILCGRLLEAALHRVLFEKTGNDILEKHPEIGLGKIIAKLEELNVVLPPGATQQIHLINQARIHSVHVKKEAFSPSKEQAHATILFTLDILKKLF